MDRKTYDITKEIALQQQAIEELKGTQPLGGKSFVNYNTYSSANNDYSLNVSVTRRFARITFTHTEPDKYHIVKLSAFARLDNPNVMANPMDVGLLTDINVINEAAQPGKHTWILEMTNLDGVPTIPHTFYIKAYFLGTTSGTFSIITI